MTSERTLGPTSARKAAARPQASRFRWWRPHMSVHEELFLNPFEKWSRYGRFPTLFFAHSLLVLLVTGQVVFYLNKDITHACQTAGHFSALLLGTPTTSVTLWQPGELQDALENAVQNIFQINDVTFNDVLYTRRGTVALRQPEDDDGMEHCDLPLILRFRNETTREVVLSRAGFTQAREKVKAYLVDMLPVLYTRDVRDLQEILVKVNLLETVHVMPVKGHFLWSLTLRYDGLNVGRFVGSLTYTLDSSGHWTKGWVHWLVDVSVICLALLSATLITRKVVKSLFVLLRLRRAARRSGPEATSAARLTWKDELALFNWWWGLSAVCHLAQLTASAACLRRTADVIERFSLLGWSCCLTWLNICQYLEFFPGYYVTFATTGKGMASVCRYMASVLPILTAFMFLGICQFWQAKTFQGVTASYASLFSLLNGDMVHDAFEDLGSVAGWSGHVYLYVFIFIFIYIVLNVNITIIEEAYYSAHFQGLKHEEQVQNARRLATPPLGGPYAKVTGEQATEAPMLPNMDSARSSSPLLCEKEAGRPRNPKLLRMRGSVSPRILENPRLQGALTAVFLPEPFTPSLLHDGSSSGAGRSTWGQSAVEPRSHSDKGHFLERPAMSDPGSRGSLQKAAEEGGLESTLEDAREQLESAEAAALAAAEAAEGSGAERGARRAEWWLRTLPRLTRLLRSTPLPSRSELSQLGEGSWDELERLVADHSGAVSEVSAALYRDLART